MSGLSKAVSRLFDRWPGRVLASVLVLFFLAWFVAGVAAYSAAKDQGPHKSAGDRDVVLLELAGSRGDANLLVCSGKDFGALPYYDLDSRLRPHLVKGDCKPAVAAYKDAVKADYWLILGYGGALVGLCLLAAVLFHERRSRRIAVLAAWAAAIAALLDVAEDVLLVNGLDGLLSAEKEWAWPWAAAASVTKFTLLLPAGVIAASAAVVILARAWSRSPKFGWTAAPAVKPPPRVINDHGDEWPHTGQGPVGPSDLARPAADVGICVSGGGIRSATVTLGALQELRRAGVLAKARYLVSVSGGGYMTGAFQLAMRPFDEGDAQAVVDPTKVFEPNSVELGHLRRHGRYVADTAKEWASALGTLLRGLVVSLGLIAGVVTVVAALLGLFYRAVPLVRPDALRRPIQGASPPAFPELSPGVGPAFLLLFGLALTLWLCSVFAVSFDSMRLASKLRAFARSLFLLTAVVVVLAIVVPGLVWLYFRALWWLNDQVSVSAPRAVAGGTTGTVVLAYLGTLASILWRKRQKIGNVGKKLTGGTGGTGGTLQRRVPTSILQRLIVWLVLLVLALAYGVLFTAVLWSAIRPGAFAVVTHWPPDIDNGWWPQWFLVVVPLVFLLVALLVDQTWMSLHPFYRRRLATAFAVRRRKADPAKGQTEIAVPYDFTKETTSLATYGQKVDGMPQMIFAAAAELSGFDRTPPGRRATSFTFSHDWVGGPQVGYVKTATLSANVKDSIRKDLTVQSAVAVSGAAFASAMGRQARAFQTLFALTNARLGTWLPNPAWLADRPTTYDDWRQPRIPRVRRVTYLLRELLGTYDSDDRMLLVTDGGHYENLGLVELLRHRCRTVYCIDSSGDAPPLAGALAYATSLAAEELGVTITLDKPLDLVPGSGSPLDPKDPLAALSARLSTATVVTGTITYPEAFQLDGEKRKSAAGRLIVAKTRLTPSMPSDLLSYAQDNPVFPHDSTSDQWFDEGQFNAYYSLGRCLGKDAVAASAAGAEPATAGPFGWLWGAFA